ncbi:MAG TPA: alanine--glyoxylate aminotransferase family protein [Anaerolineales bacterium]|jgi:alanine-glyoxylate transaminase/serine-glyoxylate transaminase/serine-pyruvate transaminase|nr:alanine--glyoxylate aminotransferase family protein [Anaerolineales bacterium]|tara:strand:- start:3693 stop:4799 length:1107 start_codon:yes stop_codon:yes gene_type:complete
MYTDLSPPTRILLGPGPTTAHPRVLRAMTTPLLGYLDPDFLAIMDDVQELLRFVFQTENKLTLAISGTGSAGMEASLCNFIESGDHVVVGVNGFFGARIAEIAARYGADVTPLQKPWGQVFSPDELESTLKKRSTKILALVHAETSTGALQPMDGIGELARRHGALLLLDTVTSLSGVPLQVDDWGVDIAYSASQKCLSCPPGLAPITVSDRAREIIQRRETTVANWYLDLSLIERYWDENRTYHHTASMSLIYALREGLRMVQEEGLQARHARHRSMAELLWDGLEELDFELHVPLEHRLPMLTTPRLYAGLDDAAVRGQLLNDYNVEIAGGFGALAGQVWRIGLMGFSSRRENVALLLAALREILA